MERKRRKEVIGEKCVIDMVLVELDCISSLVVRANHAIKNVLVSKV